MYPLLIAVAALLVFTGNALLGKGWQGASGRLLEFDFIVFNGIGELYRLDPLSMYDFNKKLAIEQLLVAPAPHFDTAPNSFPPYVGFFFSQLRHVSLGQSLVLWLLCSIIALGLGCYFLSLQLPQATRMRLPFSLILLYTVSTSAGLLGLNFGQTHAFIFLCICGICHAGLKEQHFLAGVLAGALLFKPQYALGFAILWLFRLQVRPLLAIGLCFVCYNLPLLLAVPFKQLPALWTSYFQTISVILSWMTSDLFPSSLLATPYGLLNGLLEQGTALLAAKVVGALLSVCLGYLSWNSRKVALSARPDLLAFAILFPILGSPYVMLYDLIVLVPVLILMLRWGSQRRLGDQFERGIAHIALLVYAGLIFLPLLSFISGVSFVCIVPVVLLIALLSQYSKADLLV